MPKSDLTLLSFTAETYDVTDATFSPFFFFWLCKVQFIYSINSMWMEEGLRLQDKYELFCRTVTASIRMCSKEEFDGHGRGCVSVWIPYLEG